MSRIIGMMKILSVGFKNFINLPYLVQKYISLQLKFSFQILERSKSHLETSPLDLTTIKMADHASGKSISQLTVKFH